MEEQITEAVQKVSESVVTIENSRNTRFGGFEARGAASGVIFASNGFLITNNHVVENASELEIGLKSGEIIEGTVLGRDPQTDIAVVKVRNASLPSAASLGDSSKLKVGQIALAVGNSLGLPGGHTVSTGVISALGRPLPWADFVFEGLIQTDAAINPGNSGGPLADSAGTVIGINTAIIPYAQGVGFAIPINTVKSVAEQIMQEGRVIRPYLGISGLNVDESIARRFRLSTSSGVLLANVSREGSAAEAGLAPGDVITSLGDYSIANMRDLLVALSTSRIGSVVSIGIVRGRTRHRIDLRLAEAMNRRPLLRR